MISDSFSACAAACGALAALKGKTPSSFKINSPSGVTRTIRAVYDNHNGFIRCWCGDCCAYAVNADSDFTIYINGSCDELFTQNKELLNMIFSSASKIMSGLCGAELYLNEGERI